MVPRNLAAASNNDDLARSLKGAIAKAAVASPSNAGQYVKDIKTTGEFKATEVAFSGIVDLLTKQWKLPNEVVGKFRAAAFSTSTTFQTFHYVVDTGGVGQVDEYIGASRNPGQPDSLIQLGFIKAHASGNTIQQKVGNWECTGTGHCCFPYIGFTCCCHHGTVYHNRGFSNGERQLIKQALRAAAFNQLNQEVNKVAPAQQVSTKTSAVVAMLGAPNPATTSETVRAAAASSGGGGYALLADTIHTILKAAKNYRNHHDELIREITQVSYTHWEESVSIQLIDGMVEAYFPTFRRWLTQSLEIPKDRVQEFEGKLDIIQFSDTEPWSNFEVVVDPKTDGNCKYLAVMMHHD